jgi:two-component system cell cycle sensor histidine kinase/response regulator CckA
VAAAFRAMSSFDGLVLVVAVLTMISAVVAVQYARVRQRALREIQALNEKLEVQNSRMSSVVRSVLPGVIEIENDRIAYTGTGLRDLVGYNPEEVIGAEIMSFVHPQDVPRLQHWGESLSASRSIEFRLRHKEGHWVWIKNFYIPDPLARSRGRMTFAGYDVTRDRELRDRSMQSQRLEGIGVLAAGVAHDFNDLLTVITGFAELMDESTGRKNILKAADEAAGLVQKLTAFGAQSPIEDGACDLVKVVLDTEPVLSRILLPTVQLHISAATGPLWVPLAPAQISQILLNLVTNAKEALTEGGNVWVDLETLERAPEDDHLPARSYAQITVSDDGPGMDAHTFQHAFDPFYTTKSDLSQSGLGLATVYGLVRNAGGHVALEADHGPGTAVSVKMPLRSAVVDALPDAESIEYAHGQGRILVVEDDELIADLIARSLVHAGYSVTIKNDVASAWQQLQVDMPDLLVTDIMMPDGRGTELAKRLQTINSKLPILFISGYSDQEIGEWKVTPGEVRFLAKPFRAQELLDRVGQLMVSSMPA